MRSSGWRDALERLAGRSPVRRARDRLTNCTNRETAPTNVGELRPVSNSSDTGGSQRVERSRKDPGPLIDAKEARARAGVLYWADQYLKDFPKRKNVPADALWSLIREKDRTLKDRFGKRSVMQATLENARRTKAHWLPQSYKPPF